MLPYMERYSMKYLVLIGCFGLSLLTHEAKADPVTITVQDAAEILSGCTALDGRDRVVKDGEREKIIKEPYKFNGGFLLAIAKDTIRLREIITAYQTAHNAKIVELSGGSGSVDPNSDAGKKLSIADAEMLATKQPVDLIMINEKELNLDPPNNNQIPPSVLANLSKIIVDK
jgi:hypothetical protein